LFADSSTGRKMCCLLIQQWLAASNVDFILNHITKLELMVTVVRAHGHCS